MFKNLRTSMMKFLDQEPVDLNKKPVSAVIFQGKTIEKQISCSLMSNKIPGAIAVLASGYTCPRCHKSEGFLADEKTYYSYFCGQDDCLRDDAISRKIIEGQKRGFEFQNESLKKENEIMDKRISAFGSLYQNANLASIKISPAQTAQVMKWVDDGNGFLVMVGCSGSGKTYFCAAVYYWILKKTRDIIHVNVHRFIEEIHDAINRKVNSDTVTKKYREAQYLSFDDLGSSLNGDFHKTEFLKLIDYRYEHQLPTLITSNLDYRKMCEKLDDRIATRVFDKRHILIEDWQTNYRKRS